MKLINELKNTHKGDDIYIIGSGKTLDYYPLDFFDENKIIIGINQVYKKIDCDYLVRKESSGIKNSIGKADKIIVSEYNSGNVSLDPKKLNTNKIEHDSIYYFQHLDNKHEKIDSSVFGTDKIVVSFSTITSAIHIAAYMGAKNVILVGHDCGSIDNEVTFKGYYSDISETPWQNWRQYKSWLKIIESQTIEVKKMVKKVYDCNVVSMLPFVSPNMENHIYS